MGAPTPEIVAPAGTLESGIYAFEAGADAVYFGLSRFSARAAAKNLTPREVRRLKGVAAARGKKIYAAINTVISETEADDALRAVCTVASAGADGVILQDLGLAARVRSALPELPLHGSTQLAVHTADGLLWAERHGFKRVVTARELRLGELARMGKAAPSVEREVFVHGALCYGFSGLCLASSQLTGRSGNRGECAQICRSWFDAEAGRGYFFSASDLDAGSLVKALAAAGVSALKIEGRLKSSAYGFHAVAYYRALLDGDPQRAAFHRERSALGFSRPKSIGFLEKGGGAPLVQPRYPSHVGIPGATVTRVRGGRMRIAALTELAAHDRLFRLPAGPPDEGETVVLSTFVKNGRPVHRLKKGESAELAAVSRARPGDTLMKTLAHDLHLKSLAEGSYPEWKRPLALAVSEAPGGLRFQTTLLGRTVEAVYPAPVEAARGGRSLPEILETLFSESKSHGIRFDSLTPEIDGTPLRSDRFVPPSLLKQMRNAFYEETEKGLQRPVEETRLSGGSLSGFDLPLPPRSAIRCADDFPFLPEHPAVSIADAPVIDGTRYLPLPPVMFHPERTVSRLAEQLESASDTPVAVGLCNVGHLSIAAAWATMPHLSFYIDYGLYIANRYALRFLADTVPRLRGAYLWLEADEKASAALGAAVAEMGGGVVPPGIRFIDEPERLPAFISRICFHREKNRGCPSPCSKRFDYTVTQQSRRLKVRVVDCLTYVYLLRR